MSREWQNTLKKFALATLLLVIGFGIGAQHEVDKVVHSCNEYIIENYVKDEYILRVDENNPFFFNDSFNFTPFKYSKNIT